MSTQIDERDIDDVLDHLAQGEVYAEYGVTAMYAQHARDVTDVTDAFAHVGTASFSNDALSATARFRRERYKGSVYVPKMTNEIKVIITTVIVMLACFSVLSTLAAYSVKYMASAIRYTYTDIGPQVSEQPVRADVLRSDKKFAALIEEFPEQIVSLYIKRARLFFRTARWQRSIDAFEMAQLHSVTALEMADHLDYVQSLIHLKRNKDALHHLNNLDLERMDTDERQQATNILGRLHFAVD